MRRLTEITWGALALALAAWWAAATLGLLPAGLHDLLLRALPALLIVVGLTLVLRRRVPFGGGLALVITIGLVAGVAYLAFTSRAEQERTDTQQAIDQPVDAALSLLRVRVLALSTDIEIGVNNSGTVTGQFIGSSDHAVIVDYDVGADGTSTATLTETRQSGEFPLLEAIGRGRLRLTLPAGIPLDLDITGQDGDMAINLGGVRLERLNATAANGSLVITLPAYDPAYSQADDLLGTLSATGGDLALVVPASVAARLELDRRGSGITPQFETTRYDYLQGDVLQAVDIRTASIVMRFALVAGSGAIRISTS